jgi:hypothetical protein
VIDEIFSGDGFEKGLSDKSVNKMPFSFSIFVKKNHQVTNTIFLRLQYLFFSSSMVVQTLHPSPVARLIRPFITNDIFPNFNIFFQFLLDVGPEPYLSKSMSLGTG